jgi:hypothetical protein
MYRDDRNALVMRVEALSKTEETNDALRAELLELRRALATQPSGNPYLSFPTLGPGEIAAYRAHSLERFPVWAVGILHVISLGLFSLIWFGIQQGRMPRLTNNDPTTGQAIGYQFIPFFNLYWIFFSPMRLCDRITFQYRLRGREGGGSKGVVLASAIVNVIPYIGAISFLTLWLISSCLVQHEINKLIDLDGERR